MKTSTQMIFAGAFLFTSLLYIIAFLITRAEIFGIIGMIEWACTVSLVIVTMPRLEKENKRAKA